MRLFTFALLGCALILLSGCGSPPALPAVEPSATATILPPTETPLPYDPAIYVALQSYDDVYGSVAAAFENYEEKGYCENPFREGYPRYVDGQWHLFMKNSDSGNIIIHDILTGADGQVVTFTISTSGYATSLENFSYDYRIITQYGALISLDLQGDFVHCEEDAENRLIRDFIFSPSTNDFVLRDTESGEPIGFLGPVLTIAYLDVYASEYVTGEILCDHAFPPGENYVAYTLPGGDGQVFTWGRKSLCMRLTADRIR